MKVDDVLSPSRGNDDFRLTSASLAGLASASLGWTPDQFWSATPAELAVIFSAFETAASQQTPATPIDTNQLEKLKETFPDAQSTR